MKRFIWSTYLDSLDKKYTMFYINYQYRNKSFKSEAEYTKIQVDLSKEIELLNKEIKAEIENVIYETYPEIKILLYDSRTFSRENGFVGNILTEGVKSKSETLDVRACFEKFTSMNIGVQRIEDESDEDQQTILKNIKEMKENGQI